MTPKATPLRRAPRRPPACRSDQRIVLPHDGELARRRRGRRIHISRRRTTHRRQAQLVADRKPRVGRGTAAVDAHLAGTDDAIDVGLGHALPVAEQEVVEALSFCAFVDPDPLDGRRQRWRRRRRARLHGIRRAFARDRPGLNAAYNPRHRKCVLSG
jgi:hypothetical protein